MIEDPYPIKTEQRVILDIIAGTQSIGKVVQCKAHKEKKRTSKISSKAQSAVHAHNDQEDHHDDSDSSCDSLVIKADSDEEDWFEPDVSIEMKLQAFLKSVNKDKISLVFRQL